MNDIQLVCLLAPPLIMLIILSVMYLFSCDKEENEEEDKRIKESKMKETVKKETNKLDKKLENLLHIDMVDEIILASDDEDLTRYADSKIKFLLRDIKHIDNICYLADNILNIASAIENSMNFKNQIAKEENHD